MVLPNLPFAHSRIFHSFLFAISAVLLDPFLIPLSQHSTFFLKFLIAYLEFT